MELLTEELIHLHDKHRAGSLTPQEKARLETLLETPGRRAAWTELTRIAGAYPDAPAEGLPEGFSGSVLQTVRTLDDAHRQEQAAAKKPLFAPTWRRAAGAAAAAALFAGGFLTRFALEPVPVPVLGGARLTQYRCRPASALVAGEPRPLSAVRHRQPDVIRTESGSVPPEIRQSAPEAQLCAEKDATPCGTWLPAEGVVLLYRCETE